MNRIHSDCLEVGHLLLFWSMVFVAFRRFTAVLSSILHPWLCHRGGNRNRRSGKSSSDWAQEEELDTKV
ncbi:hypothetical protein Dthio_PD0007 [Desulfonatronospira thiodismutans ASO3-1]|uniref:Uncharacterized protein n=1 Tax=Desulfonatronospira thiodismutans ASO3-1 TaxID=555779 RepID=D6SUW8_9BACT|nr:hypothetical protein Dthio_PD0007 [Desulfonatronospira thiodismutans ASO3-1]